jgi:hypothetical protein
MVSANAQDSGLKEAGIYGIVGERRPNGVIDADKSPLHMDVFQSMDTCFTIFSTAFNQV